MGTWRWLSLGSLALILSACAQHLPLAVESVPDGLRHLGEVAGSAAATTDIVLLCDRHETHGAITRSSSAWMALRKANARAVRFLLTKGFSLLGAEAALGPLPDDTIAYAHRQAWTEARDQGEDIDAINIYQPLRFQWDHAPQLEVWGIEDPAQYALDTDALERINALRLAEFANQAEVDAAKLAITALTDQIRSRADARGTAAARNLHERMQQSGAERAMLLLGSAHCVAALRELQRLGHGVLFFRAHAMNQVVPRGR